MIRKHRTHQMQIFVRCLNSGKVFPARIRSWYTASKGRGMGRRMSYSVVVFGNGRDAWETICSGKYALFRFVYTRDLIKLFQTVQLLKEVQLG